MIPLNHDYDISFPTSPWSRARQKGDDVILERVKPDSAPRRVSIDRQIFRSPGLSDSLSTFSTYGPHLPLFFFPTLTSLQPQADPHQRLVPL